MLNIPAGTVVIREGEHCMDMYKIIMGKAEVYSGYGTDHEAILGIKSKNDYFGEIGLFTGGNPAIYTVVAYSDLVLLRITETSVEKFITENHVDAYNIMRHMAESMYAMKYSMDMYINDLEEQSGNKDMRLKALSGFVAKQLVRNYSGHADTVLAEGRRFNLKT